MNTAQEILKAELDKIQEVIIKLVKDKFKADQEISPILFTLDKKSRTSEPITNLVPVSDAFSLPKQLRNLMLGKIIATLNPMICVLATEAWGVKRESIDRPINMISPLTEDDRQELVNIFLASPFESRMIMIPVIRDFQNIDVNGIPHKYLSGDMEIFIDNESGSSESFIKDLFKKNGKTKEQVCEILK